tara:strand:- start:1113 stop:1523 length:411 start_codon:yes stop_codon:yes gene_type:complete
MYKRLIKGSLIFVFSIISFGQDYVFPHRQFEIKSKAEIDSKNTTKLSSQQENRASLQEKFDNDFENYQSFKDSVKPSNQFLNLFGIGGFADQRLKNSSFNLWDTFEKEMSNQLGTQKLRGIDINNTFNESLNTLGH